MRYTPTRFAFVAVAIILISCGTAPTLQREIEAGLEQSVGSDIAISRITSFRWDHLYFFSPYSEPARVQQRLGFAWTDPALEDLKYNEGAVLVVFVRRQAVVRSVLFPRNIADFSGVGFDQAFLPNFRYHVERASRPKYSVVPVYSEGVPKK